MHNHRGTISSSSSLSAVSCCLSLLIYYSILCSSLQNADAFTTTTSSSSTISTTITSKYHPSSAVTVAIRPSTKEYSHCTISRITTTPSTPTTPLYATHDDINIDDVPDVQMTEEELTFLSRTKELCETRNIKFDAIKNARDIASVNNSPAKPGRVVRMGRPSDASQGDICTLLEDLDVKTLVDLRSPTELKDDPTLERPELFQGFVSMIWLERGVDGKVIEMKPGEPRIKKSVRKRVMDSFFNLLAPPEEEKETFSDQLDDEINEVGLKATLSPKELCDCGTLARCDRKERHFVSLMNEYKYVKGTLSKLRKRDIARVLIKSPGAIVSRRVRTGVKDVFLDEINDGGLPMLNELLLRFGAPGIKYVLDLCADKTRHPVAFYCTAGKDRTGMITALILSVLGVPDEDIVEDYSLSANVYAEMNDHKAMVGALSQRNLDPKTFLGAPPGVMRDTLKGIRETYGSVDGYLDFIGFDEESREKLKDALLS